MKEEDVAVLQSPAGGQPPAMVLLGGYPVLAGERAGNEVQQCGQREGRKQLQAHSGVRGHHTRNSEVQLFLEDGGLLLCKLALSLMVERAEGRRAWRAWC